MTGGLLLGLVMAACGGGLSAQAAEGTTSATVLGRVLDESTGAPQEGAFVTLLDEEGARLAGVLADQAGRFVLRAPAPGRYRLKVERIGVEGMLSDVFAVSPGQVSNRDLTTRPMAVALDGLVITGTGRCDLGDEGSATVRLWEEARKALEVAEWVEASGYVYDTRTFTRVLGARNRMVREETASRNTFVGRSPFRSLDVGTLLEHGFVHEDGEGRVYYAPDAAVLLSDAFLSTHCFQAVRDEGGMGLAFEPASGRGVPEVNGVLRFDEQGLLDRLEFRYVGADLRVDGDEALGGEIFFQRLAGGEWVVREWRIRMPLEVERRTVRLPGQGSRTETRLTFLRETGGEVLRVQAQERVEIFDDRRGAVRGRVVHAGTDSPGSGSRGADPTRKGGVSDPDAPGRVFLSGTAHRASVAEDGSFLIENVSPGLYQLVTTAAGLHELGLGTLTVPVEVVADSVAVAEVEIPTREEVLVDRCASGPFLELEPPDSRSGASSLVGGVVLDGRGRPVADWPVRVRWTRTEITPDQTAVQRWRGTVVFSGATGGWAVCGTPHDVYLTVEAAREALTADEVAEGEGRWQNAEPVGLMGPGQIVWVPLSGGGL